MEKLFGFYSSFKNATGATEKLTEIDIPCDFVMLSLWSVTDDLNDAPIPEYVPPSGGVPEGSEATRPILILYGFGGQAVHELAPGETTRLIPCRNVREVYVRALKNAHTRVYFSCFKSD